MRKGVRHVLLRHILRKQNLALGHPRTYGLSIAARAEVPYAYERVWRLETQISKTYIGEQESSKGSCSYKCLFSERALFYKLKKALSLLENFFLCYQKILGCWPTTGFLRSLSDLYWNAYNIFRR